MTHRFKAIWLFAVLMSAVGAWTAGAQSENIIYLPAVQHTTTPAEPAPGWLQYTNQIRAQAALPPLTENESWSEGAVLHSRYVVKEDDLTHYEDRDSDWYTPEGYDAGRYGNIMASGNIDTPETAAIDIWMTGPFHAIGIIDPVLTATGFGVYREDVGSRRMAATMDVLRGGGPLPDGISFPVTFPQNDGEIWYTSYDGNEYPDPLSSCDGYSAPSGPPLIIQLGALWSVVPDITASSFAHGDTPLEHCVFDETSYVNENGSNQTLGRSILDSRDAVVLMPRRPLQVGETYTASITNGTETHTWRFTVVAHPHGRTPAAGIEIR